MGWFLLDWSVPDVLAKASGIAFSTPRGITKQKACFPFMPRPRIRAAVRVGMPPRLLVLRPSPARLV